MEPDSRPKGPLGFTAPEFFRGRVPESVQLEGTLPGRELDYRSFIVRSGEGCVTGIRIPLDEIPFIPREHLLRHLHLIATQWACKAALVEDDSKPAYIELQFSPAVFPQGTPEKLEKQRELLCSAVRHLFSDLIGPIRQMDSSRIYGDDFEIEEGRGDLTSVVAGLKTGAFDDIKGFPIQYEEINGAGIVVQTRIPGTKGAEEEIAAIAGKNALHCVFFEAGGNRYLAVSTDFPPDRSERNARWNLRLFVSCYLEQLRGDV